MTTPHDLGDLGPGAPTAPIALPDAAAATARLAARFVEVDEAMQARLAEVCSSVDVTEAARAEASRDWWPLAMIWALDNQVAGRAAVIARPRMGTVKSSDFTTNFTQGRYAASAKMSQFATWLAT